MNMWTKLAQVLGDRRVTPSIPAGRMPFVVDEDDAIAVPDVAPLRAAPEEGWSFYIRYAGGSLSERRITVRKLSVERSRLIRLMAFCHERKALREFRADRIAEAIDYATGEVFDGSQFGTFLVDRLDQLPEVRMSAVIRILVFMSQCDGWSTPEEWAAIESSIVRIARALLHDDSGCNRMILEARRQAPDSEDFIKALRYLRKNRLPSRVHEELKRGIAAVIDADGKHHPDEVHWAVTASELIAEFPTSD